jgi:hypothetical protein
MADIRKKVFLPYLECLKLLNCSCMRLHLGIPNDYKNVIGDTLNV